MEALEQIRPWPFILSKGKGKISSDCCGECFAVFYDKDPVKCADKLKEHIADLCPKYRTLKAKASAN